jgi:hypothetical protein
MKKPTGQMGMSFFRDLYTENKLLVILCAVLAAVIAGLMCVDVCYRRGTL